jgi:5-methylcytosine-specific restriction endonuclease McrA
LSAHRRAQKLKATPAWLTLEHLKEIKLLYLKSKIISKETGTQHQVDHIVPLLGKEVCGLHVPWNLRVITAEENRKKCNKLESTVVPKPSLWD